MGILIGNDTRLIVQGITGSQGRYHTQQMLAYGTNVTAGVTPGKGGSSLFGVPIYHTVLEAKEATHANTSIIFVPPVHAANSILEAIDAGIDLVVCITEGIPILDMIKIKNYLRGKKTRLIGPNCPGLITPGQCKVGILPGSIHLPGHVGVVSRSGTLTYETVGQLSSFNIGQSSAVGIGGDPIKGMDFIDVLDLFNRDPDTYAVVMIGEIGGTGEEEAARWIKEHMKKPVAAFIAGQTAPPGRRMGHAGAIIAGNSGTAREKINVLNDCGITVAATPDKIGETLKAALLKAGILFQCMVNV